MSDGTICKCGHDETVSDEHGREWCPRCGKQVVEPKHPVDRLSEWMKAHPDKTVRICHYALGTDPSRTWWECNLNDLVTGDTDAGEETSRDEAITAALGAWEAEHA